VDEYREGEGVPGVRTGTAAVAPLSKESGRGRGPDVPSARERLLAAANQLFYAEGIQTVGIDRIVGHAGVAKASLYNLFGNKEGLVQAYLASRHDATTAHIEEAIGRHRDPRRRLLAVFEAQGEIFAQPDFRGCAFTAASAETGNGALVAEAAAEYRSRIRALFTDLASQAGVADPGELARQLQAVFDGAGVSASLDHDPSIARSARAAAEALLDAST
jgi:AcrR family transcriptional regulator